MAVRRRVDVPGPIGVLGVASDVRWSVARLTHSVFQVSTVVVRMCSRWDAVASMYVVEERDAPPVRRQQLLPLYQTLTNEMSRQLRLATTMRLRDRVAIQICPPTREPTDLLRDALEVEMEADSGRV